MMATDHDPAFRDQPQSVTASLPRDVHAQRLASNPAASGQSSGGSLGTVFASAVLAMLFGGAGAWAYLDYLGPMLKNRQNELGKQSLAEPGTTEETAIQSKVDDLAAQVEKLQSRMDRRPSPVTSREIEPLKEQLASLQPLPQKLNDLDTRLSPLPAQVDEHGKKLTAIVGDIGNVRKQVESLKTEVQASAKTEAGKKNDESLIQTSNETPGESEPSHSMALEPGMDLFQKKHYDRASEYFQSMTKGMPNDARVWYLAAISRGLATNNWKGETEKLVKEGIEREKAGKPGKEKIDSTFDKLTKETGKDWLEFFRRQAH